MEKPMGGTPITLEEAAIVKAFVSQGISVDEICECRHHSHSTISAIVEGWHPVLQPQVYFPVTRQPDPTGPEITVEQQVAVDQAASMAPWGPKRYRLIAAAAGVDLDTAYLLLLGRYPPGPMRRIGDEADRNLFYAEPDQKPTQTPQITGYDFAIDNPAAEVKTAGEGPGKGVTRT